MVRKGRERFLGSECADSSGLVVLSAVRKGRSRVRVNLDVRITLRDGNATASEGQMLVLNSYCTVD